MRRAPVSRPPTGQTFYVCDSLAPFGLSPDLRFYTASTELTTPFWLAPASMTSGSSFKFVGLGR